MLQFIRNFSTNFNTTTVLNIRVTVLYVCANLYAHHPALTLHKGTWLTVLRNFIRKIPSFHARFTDSLSPTYKSICTVLTPCIKTNGLVERQGILIEYTMTIAGFDRIADFFPNGQFAGLSHAEVLRHLQATKTDLPYGGELELVSLVGYLRGSRKVHERLDLREAMFKTSELNAHYPVITPVPSPISQFNSILNSFSFNVRSFISLVKLSIAPIQFLFAGILFNTLAGSLVSLSIVPLDLASYLFSIISNFNLIDYGVFSSLGLFFSEIILAFQSSILTVIIIVTVPMLLVVAFTTLFERQVMASMQRRMGPHTSGIGGILQPFYDGLKLGVKEPLLPEMSASGPFTVAPMIAFILSQVSLSVLFISDSSYQGIILMALSSLAVYGVLLAGWASNSKYSFLGALRSVALMVSYELGFGAILLSICLFLTDSTGMKSLNFADASPFVQAALLPLLLVFLICILAESKRIPFDLPEAKKITFGFLKYRYMLENR